MSSTFAGMRDLDPGQARRCGPVYLRRTLFDEAEIRGFNCYVLDPTAAKGEAPWRWIGYSRTEGEADTLIKAHAVGRGYLVPDWSEGAERSYDGCGEPIGGRTQ